MIVTELFEPAKPGYESPGLDNTPLKLSDLRKTRLTLADLSRLRMANDVRKVEHEKKLEKHLQFLRNLIPIFLSSNIRY